MAVDLSTKLQQERMLVFHSCLIGQGIAELNILGRDGWQIKAAVRGLTGNTEVVYLERELEM